MRAIGCIVLLSLGAHGAAAQSPAPGGMPPPAGMSLAASAAMRFPQPVRAGDLVGRTVIRATESQDYVGTVRGLVERRDGTVLAVIGLGGFLGFGVRTVGVPIDAMVLVGDVMEVTAFTPEQLHGFPTFDPAGTAPVPPDAVLRVGLAKPSH